MSKNLWLLALVLAIRPAFGALPAPASIAEPSGSAATIVQSPDPYEAVNRQIFAFNAWLTNDLINPAAAWLSWLVPTPVQQAGYNIYNNLVEPEFIFNNLVAGNTDGALVSGQRFLINTTIGVAGVWDAASWLGYERHEVELTESVCAAGIAPGDYIVLPIIGAATLAPSVMVTGVFAAEWYLLSSLAPSLATASLLLDVGASAAGLKHALNQPTSEARDSYQVQRDEFLLYVDSHCSTDNPISI